MTLDSSAIVWIALIVGVLIAVALLLRWRGTGQRPTIDHERIMEQTRRVAEEAARTAAQEAQEAAVRAYEEQQRLQRVEEAAKRHEAGLRAKETKRKRIEGLKEWREPFVQFIRRLGEPFFIAYSVDPARLEEWAEERADVYISRKPYVLEIVQSIHADAQHAAEDLSSQRSKSPAETARERARGAGRKLVRNAECPYCGASLSDGNDHLDHIRPVNRGGPTVDWNLVFVCIPCNRAKRDLSLAEFIETDYARRKELRLRDVLGRLEALGKHVDILR